MENEIVSFSSIKNRLKRWFKLSEDEIYKIEQYIDRKNSNRVNYKIMELSCQYGHLDIVKLLCDKGCDPKYDNCIFMKLADKRFNWDIVEYLLRQGCDIRYLSRLGINNIRIYGILPHVIFECKHCMNSWNKERT